LPLFLSLEGRDDRPPGRFVVVGDVCYRLTGRKAPTKVLLGPQTRVVPVRTAGAEAAGGLGKKVDGMEADGTGEK
jgi:hypothetical protein